MGYVTLEITLISAKDLKNVNLIGKMDIYVVGTLSTDDPKNTTNKQKTPVCQDGGTKPSWNHTMHFTVDQSAAGSNLEVVFSLKHESFGPDKDVGEVRIPVRELMNNTTIVSADSKAKDDRKEPQVSVFQVKRPSGKTQGELRVSYRVFEAPEYQPAVNQTKYAPAAAAYPPSATAAYPAPPPPMHAGGYPPHGGAVPVEAYPYGAPPPPPPQQGGYPPYGNYPPPPQQGYPPAGPYGGYPQQPYQQPGYGYAPQQPGGYPAGASGQYYQQQNPKKSGLGGGSGMALGLGAGLIGGAVGGLIVGDMVEDAMDDGGDFDF